MSRTAWVILGVAFVVVGGLWTFQGLGYVGGSAMSGQEQWAIIGPAVAGIGVAMVVVATRPRD
jgi:hypothetical protein